MESDVACPICTMADVLTTATGDHEIDCKIDGRGILLKAKFVKKA
jgi:uncharacterized Zn ribbon protein